MNIWKELRGPLITILVALAPLIGIGAAVGITVWLSVTGAWVTTLARGWGSLVLAVVMSLATGGLYVVIDRLSRRDWKQELPAEPPGAAEFDRHIGKMLDEAEIDRRIDGVLGIPERELRLIRQLRFNRPLRLTRRVSVYLVMTATAAVWSWTLYVTVKLGLPPDVTRVLAISAALAVDIVGWCWRRGLVSEAERQVRSQPEG